jgi:hypothetical protein
VPEVDALILERQQAVARIQELQRRFDKRYGEMQDSTILVREDRSR